MVPGRRVRTAVNRELYRVSACSVSVSATHVAAFAGTLGSRFSLTDKPCERLSPGVVVLSPVDHTRDRKNTEHSRWTQTGGHTTVTLCHAAGTNSGTRQHTLSPARGAARTRRQAREPPASSCDELIPAQPCPSTSHTSCSSITTLNDCPKLYFRLRFKSVDPKVTFLPTEAHLP